jgi:LysM repeat protein
VLGGAVLVLALLITGGLWVFGVIGGDGGGDRAGAAKGLGDDAGIVDPIGRGPAVFEQGSAIADRDRGDRSSPPGLLPEPGRTGTETGDTGTSTNREPVERRNILREGLENARNGGGSGAPVVTPGVSPAGEATKDGTGVLATDNGGSGALTGASAAVAARIAEADRLIRSNEPLEARRVLNEALKSRSIGASDAATLRTRLGELNADLVFSPRVTPGDPLTEVYEVQSGDRLSKIAAKRELATHWKLIQRVNGLSNPNVIRLGQKLKLVRGPFHAVVDKSDFRVDIYQGAPNAPEDWLYIRSFDVGLGKDDGTPLGTFVVGRNAKVENPGWVNPHDPTEKYGPRDPKNPIGLFWIGLEGVGDSAAYTGYGLHGTIEPESIGTEASLGCVRLRAEDIERLYELLEEGISVVKIVP